MARQTIHAVVCVVVAHRPRANEGTAWLVDARLVNDGMSTNRRGTSPPTSTLVSLSQIRSTPYRFMHIHPSHNWYALTVPYFILDVFFAKDLSTRRVPCDTRRETV